MLKLDLTLVTPDDRQPPAGICMGHTRVERSGVANDQSGLAEERDS